MRSWIATALLGFAVAPAVAQDLVVYDDVLRNSFQNYSYGGGSDFAHGTVVRTGAQSVAFTPNNFNAASFARPGVPDLTTAQYPMLRFYVHGGASGGQALRIFVQRSSEATSMELANAPLAPYVSGGAIAANQWREVVVPLGTGALTFAGGFDRIDLAADDGPAQATVYFDDVTLVGAAQADPIFADGFEGAVPGPAGMLQFTPAAPNQDVVETIGTATFTVARIGGSTGGVGTTVTLGGNATNPDDYTASALALSWPNGDTTPRTVTLTIAADLVDEAPEFVTLALGAPTGGAILGAPTSATLTIRDAELLFVPQYARAQAGGNDLEIWRRNGAGALAFLRGVPLDVTARPNAVAFAPDGKLYVLGNVANQLRRYSRQELLSAANPVAEATINLSAGAESFDLAFFGDFLYVSQSDFGATDRILKYSIASLAASGTPAPAATLTNASLDVPAGLAFDPQGRLWVSNFGNDTLVRMDTTTGVVDRTGTNVGTPNARNALNRPEGLAFDSAGTLWVGNNGEPTISAYSSAQLAALGATTPVHQIDVNAALFQGDTVGGLAFDAIGRLWANYQKTFAVLEYALTPQGGGYVSALGQTLTDATTFPGFGGLAFWPVPATLERGMPGGGGVVASLDHDENVSVAGMTSDRYAWIDAGGNARSVVLAHNDKGQGPTSAGGYPNHGGAMREYRFTMPGGAERTATVTTYGNAGQGGFGYAVSHARMPCGGDDSPLGYGTPGTFQRLSTGRHHAIFRVTQNYPRRCNAAGAVAPATVPVTIDWFFATGRDNPIWAITYDLSTFAAGRFDDDSRAPYGELNIDGDGFTHNVTGVAWGDRFAFSATSPGGVHLGSPWTWNAPNTVPWVKLWIAASDATMGIVATRTLDQQDAGGGRNRFVYDLRNWWNESSPGNDAGPGYAMPDQNYWPYQANSFSIGVGVPNNNARLTWGTQYGFLGQASYETNNVLPAGDNTGNAAGMSRKSYATYVVLGAHSTAPVEAQVDEIEAVQATTFTSIPADDVRTFGTAGPGRVDFANFDPPGWDHVYGIWTVEVDGNAADVNFAIGAGHQLRNPIFKLRNWQGTMLPSQVRLNGIALVQDVDYFPSIVDAADELLITVSRTLVGATNRIVVTP